MDIVREAVKRKSYSSKTKMVVLFNLQQIFMFRGDNLYYQN